MSKVVITTTGETPDAPMDPRFGRAARFLVYDLDSKSFEVIDNSESLGAAHGAGISAAQSVAKTGAKVLISGNVGPKAAEVLAAGGIEMYSFNGATVAEALEAYRQGKLTKIK
jgi:predicted Fe-Mo cluster-binding NifX family protein